MGRMSLLPWTSSRVPLSGHRWDLSQADGVPGETGVVLVSQSVVMKMASLCHRRSFSEEPKPDLHKADMCGLNQGHFSFSVVGVNVNTARVFFSF